MISYVIDGEMISGTIFMVLNLGLIVMISYDRVLMI